MSKTYIVYKITHKKNKKIYIGVHATDNEDDGYMGSGTNIKKAIKEHGVENFDKSILYRFDNAEDALKKEKELVNRQFISRNDTYNISLGGGFLTVDSVPVKDKNGNYLRVHKNDPRYLNGELVYNLADFIVVKDKDGNIFQVPVDDPRFKSGELNGVNVDKFTAKDKDGNTFQVSVNDPRYKCGELNGATKNMVIVKDKDNNTMMVDVNDPRYKSGELVHFWKDRKHTEESKRKIGEANSKHQKGKGNSHYGTMWIYNEKLKKSKRINKNDKIPQGWKKGRKIKF